MPLTEAEEEKLNDFLVEFEENRKFLSDWERAFLDDQIKRYADFKSKMSLSPKQWAVLNRMYEKITEVDK